MKISTRLELFACSQVIHLGILVIGKSTTCMNGIVLKTLLFLEFIIKNIKENLIRVYFNAKTPLSTSFRIL